jgi:NAD(P)-dependent dehydrogenase (short-subunit alcohol dehydrogenase family)
MKTILITGASSGIGKATALRFQSEGWNVIATMRDPCRRGGPGRALDNVLVTRLDVTDAVSIASAVSEGIARFGRIDALLNNAGLRCLWPSRSLLDRPHPPAVRHQRDRPSGGDEGRAAAYAREPRRAPSSTSRPSAGRSPSRSAHCITAPSSPSKACRRRCTTNWSRSASGCASSSPG